MSSHTQTAKLIQVPPARVATQGPPPRSGRSTLAALLLVVGLAPACREDEPARLPVSKQSIAQTAEANLRNATANLGPATAFLAESDSLAATLGMFATCESTSTPPGCAFDDPTCAEPSQPTGDATSAGCDTATMKQDMQRMHGELQQELDKAIMKVREEYFAPANIESESATEIVYRLPLSVLCPPATAEPTCAEDAAKTQPRLRVTSPAQGDLDVAVLVTQAKHVPFIVHLHRAKLGVRMDIGELMKAAQVIDPTSVEGVTRAAGTIEIALVKNAERDFSLIAQVVRTIDVAMTEQGKTTTFQLDATSKTYEINLNGTARTVTAAVNMGALRINAPLDEFVGQLKPGVAAQTMRLVVGGINGSVTFNGMNDVLALRGLGLGNQSTSVTVGSAEVFKMDVNPEAGRRFDLTVSMADTDQPLLTFAPGLDARLRFHFQPIESLLAEPLSDFMKNDNLRIQLSGNNPALRSVPAGMQVVSGTLSITSTAVPAANITVNAGQCLVDDPTVVNTHDLLSGLAAGACM